MLLRECLRQVAGRDQAEADEHLAERQSASLLFGQALFQALHGEEPSPDEECAEKGPAPGLIRFVVRLRELDSHAIPIGGRGCPH